MAPFTPKAPTPQPYPLSPSDLKHYNNPSGNGSTSTSATSSTTPDPPNPTQSTVSPADGLHMMRQGPQATIAKLRSDLEQASQRDHAARAALAKSDAVILELRSGVRQLKRQVEQAQREKEELRQDQMSGDARDGTVGELQVQLDRAHAQILTADMVRKELEDTLEAEQYTWELRVQDQERQIQQLQHDLHTLREELTRVRDQLKNAEAEWSRGAKQMQREIGGALSAGGAVPGSPEMMKRLQKLEAEREELQGCLDEAMQELEAVDRELRQHPDVMEPLQGLYRWLWDRSGEPEEAEVPKDANELVVRIQEMVEDSTGGGGGGAVEELEAKLSVYRGDLKAKEESSAELRTSLKEAVALLKPLQDAVAKADSEKKALEEQLDEVTREKQRVEDEKNAQIQKLGAHSKFLQQRLASMSSISPAASLRNLDSTDDSSERSSAKRRSEEKLQKLLNNAQSRFQELHNENYDVVAENQKLRARLAEAESYLQNQGGGGAAGRDVPLGVQEGAVKQLHQDLENVMAQLREREEQVEQLEQEVQKARGKTPVLADDFENMQMKVHRLERDAKRKQEAEQELEQSRIELAKKMESEQILNASLKEALSLLKPLQQHLETAEREKKDLYKQLKSAKKRLRQGQLNRSTSRDQNGEIDAALQNQGKLQEALTDAQSRYNVMQSKLNEANHENQALVDVLKEKQEAETEMVDEINALRQRLENSEHELENAKYIATSALMKVEELTMASMSGNGESGSGEVVQLRSHIQSLEQEVRTARELNESLEESINERDRILDAMARQQEQRSNPSGYAAGVNRNERWEG